jgi:hypothetical protein
VGTSLPIDNVTLLRHEPPPDPPRERPWWVAPLVFLIGAAIFLAAAWFALGDPGRTRLVVILLGACAAAFGLWRMWIGWQEDGLFGAFCRDDHPMGSMLAGDEERDGLVIAFWILSGLAVILVVVLMAAAPSAFAKRSPAAPPAAVAPSSGRR